MRWGLQHKDLCQSSLNARRRPRATSRLPPQDARQPHRAGRALQRSQDPVGGQHHEDVGRAEGEVHEAPQQQQLKPERKGRRGIGELGQEGDEEERRLGVQQLHQHALHEGPPGPHHSHLQRPPVRGLLTDDRKAEPDQVGCSQELHQAVKRRHVGEDDREPQGGRSHVDIAAQVQAERRHETGPSAAGHCPRRGVENGRAGDVGKERGGREEGQQIF